MTSYIDYSTFNNEANPLSSSNPFYNDYLDIDNDNYYQSQELTRTRSFHDIDDESMYLEQNEEKMVYITDELREMKDLFGNLQDIVDDGQEVVDLIETSVQAVKDDVVSGADHLIKAEKHAKKIRCNRCICFIGLIMIISLFLVYLWFTDLESHR